MTGTFKLYLWPPYLGSRTTCPLLPSPIHLIRTNGDSVNKKMGEHVPRRRSADNHLAMWIKASNQWQWQIGDLAAQYADVSLISAACYTAHHATCILYCNLDFSMIVSWLLLSGIRTYRFPTSHIICLLSFHSTHYVALRSVDGIARLADLYPSRHP